MSQFAYPDMPEAHCDGLRFAATSRLPPLTAFRKVCQRASGGLAKVGVDADVHEPMWHSSAIQPLNVVRERTRGVRSMRRRSGVSMPSNVEDHPYREFERAGWARAAASYADSFETITRLFAEPLLEAIGVGPQKRVLDVACGSGYLTAMAASLGALVDGIDFSHDMVDAAGKRYPALQFQQADAEALPFADGTFDAVAIGFGVHHFPFPVRALVEARRVLRSGGLLGFTVWASIDEHMIQKVVVDAVRETGNPVAALPVSPAGAISDTETCLRLLREAGFDSPAPRAEKIESRASIKSAQQLIELLTEGTVRLSAVIRSQPPEQEAALVTAVHRAIGRYRDGEVFKIPAVAVLAAGVKA